jgi:hypothetical protein
MSIQIKHHTKIRFAVEGNYLIVLVKHLFADALNRRSLSISV